MLQIDGFLYRTKLSQQSAVSAAWMSAAWQRSKRMPALRTILNRMGAKSGRLDKKTVDQAKQEFKNLVDEMTGDLNLKREGSDG